MKLRSFILVSVTLMNQAFANGESPLKAGLQCFNESETTQTEIKKIYQDNTGWVVLSNQEQGSTWLQCTPSDDHSEDPILLHLWNCKDESGKYHVTFEYGGFMQKLYGVLEINKQQDPEMLWCP